jgi:hypothetical protein
MRIKAAVKLGENLHLPIMNPTREHYVPLDHTIGAFYIIRNRRLPVTGNVKKPRKRLFERALPTPNILPKTNLGSNPKIVSNMPLKGPPTLTDKLPKPHPMSLRNITRTPTTPGRTILSH